MPSAILKVELHRSSIAKKFTILAFYKSICGVFLGLYAKFYLHMAYGIPNVNVLRSKQLEAIKLQTKATLSIKGNAKRGEFSYFGMGIKIQ